MKNFAFSLAFLSLTYSATAQEQGIHFESNSTWAQIKEKAKSENKFILVETYATWCGPCKVMSEEVFPLTEVGDAINPNFLSVKFQMDKTVGDSEFIKSTYKDSKAIDSAYKIEGYPTILFFSPEGRIVSRFSGTRDGTGLIVEANKALNPNTQYYTLLEKFHANKLDTAGMKSLVYLANAAGEKTISYKIAENYASHLSKNDLYKKVNLEFIGQFLTGSNDRNFNVFFQESEKVNEITGVQYYAERIIMNIVSRELINPHINDKVIDWEKIEKKANVQFGDIGDEVIWGYRMLDADVKKDWTNFGKYFTLYFNKAIPLGRSLFHINNICWDVVEHVKDLQVIKSAVKAAKYNVENFGMNDPGDIDTYANLLYKAGRKDEAVEWEDKAVKLSDNSKEFVEILAKMKAGVKIY